MTEIGELVLEIRRRIREMSGVETYWAEEPTSASEVAAAEEELGFVIPDALREIYAVCEGTDLGVAGVLPVGRLSELKENGEEVLSMLNEPDAPGGTFSGESGVLPNGPVAFFMYTQPLVYAITRSGPEIGRLHSLNSWAVDAIAMTGQHLDSWDHVAWSMSDYLQCVIELIDAGYFFTSMESTSIAALRPGHQAGPESYVEWISDNWLPVSTILNKWSCGAGAIDMVNQEFDHLRQELTWHRRG